MHIVAHQTAILLQLQRVLAPKSRSQKWCLTYSTGLDKLRLDFVDEEIVEPCICDEVDDFLLIANQVSAFPSVYETKQGTNLDAIPDGVNLHVLARNLQLGWDPDTEDADIDEGNDSEHEPAQDVLRRTVRPTR